MKGFSPPNADAFALWITRRVGTMSFFGILLLWILFWLIWNTLAPFSLRFDPYPTFALWVFLSNMLQTFLTPLLMIGQNLDTRNSEARAEENFARIVHVEQEIEQILLYLDGYHQRLRDLIVLHEAQHREMLYRVAQIRQLMTSTIAERCREDSLCS